MNINDLIKRFDKNMSLNSDFEYKLNDSTNEQDFDLLELRIKKRIPEKVKMFLGEYSGLETSNPDLKILNVRELEDNNNLIHFATFDKDIEICFRTDCLNDAKEWTIINKETEFEITKTISSFWSNKIWHWLEKKRKIWTDDWWKN